MPKVSVSDSPDSWSASVLLSRLEMQQALDGGGGEDFDTWL